MALLLAQSNFQFVAAIDMNFKFCDKRNQLLIFKNFKVSSLNNCDNCIKYSLLLLFYTLFCAFKVNEVLVPVSSGL